MKIPTSAEFFNSAFKLISLASTTELPERTKYDSAGKTVPNLFNGKPTYRSGLKAVQLDNGEFKGEVRNMTISVLKQPEKGLKLGGFYRVAGAVWITPYLLNGRVHYSVIVEKIEQVLSLGGSDNGN